LDLEFESKLRSAQPHDSLYSATDIERLRGANMNRSTNDEKLTASYQWGVERKRALLDREADA
jgi:hypothetical protein